MTSTLFSALLAAASLGPDGPQTIPLWPGGAPGFDSRRDEPEQAESYWVKNVHNPSITAFLPPEPAQVAVTPAK